MATTIIVEAWKPWLQRLLVSFAMCIGLLGAFYVRLLSRDNQRLWAELVQTKGELSELQNETGLASSMVASRVDYVERVLFGEVVAKLSAQKPALTARVERWQKNRDRELSDRITYLERRVYDLESRVK